MWCRPLLGWADLQLLAMSCIRDRGLVPSNLERQYSMTMTRIANWMINMQTQTGSIANNPIATILAVQVSSLI